MDITGVVRLSPETGTANVPPIEGYEVLSAQWRETEYLAYGGPAKEYTGGFWTGEPGAVRIDPWPYDEICVILSGRVAVADLDGGRAEFGAGEAFFIPRGFAGDWVTIEPTSKVFVAVTR
ncbi:cupin domain-containing protein [Actinomadura montaniterrae]|uniref:Cupin domain-containing protein n=1 Tax=Actinomadura montaniterrae TaxID=1803903 RepID=A0A6L3W1K7_9ACTN|nr:cupin domain-containing protein [Actinomadura montaniterrae]KAB2388783.1 cupin domain-containing protein [Actinomadura montaniterrae]